MPAERSVARATAGAIFLLALGLRILFVVQSARSPYFEVRGLDGETYHEMALGLAAGEWPGSAPFFRPPLYPLLLAAWYRLAGESVLALKLLQAVLGSFSAVLTYALGRHAFGGRRIALLAALVVCCHGALIYSDGELLPEAADTLLQLSALLLLMRGAATGRLSWWILAGGAIGLAAIQRGEALLLVPLALLWFFWPGPEGRSALRSSVSWKRAACLLAPVAALVAPVTLHNARHDGLPLPTDVEPPAPLSAAGALGGLIRGRTSLVSGNSGVNFYLGNHSAVGARNDINHPGHFDLYDEVVDLPIRAGIRSSAGRSRYLVRETLRDIGHDPGSFVQRLGQKALQAVNGTEISRNSNLYAHRRESVVLRLAVWKRGLAFPDGLLIPLALLGLAVARPRDRAGFLLAGRLASIAGVMLVYFVTARYRAPAVPILALYASAAFFWLIGRLRARGPARPLAAGCAFLALALVVSNLDFVDANPDYAEPERLRLARLYGERGDLAAEEAVFREVLARNPDSVPALVNLGSTLRMLGRADEAALPLEAALALDPGNPVAHNALGLIDLAAGRLAEAEAHLREALRASTTGAATLHSNLGSILVRQGRREEALVEYESALVLDPRHADALYNVGAVLEVQGDIAGAIARYRQALEARPDHAAARRKLDRLERRGAP